MSSKEKLLVSAQKNLQKGQIAKAIKDYQQVVELDPKDIRNRQKLAELLCRAGMNTEALGEYGKVAGYYGDNGFYLKAIAVYKQIQKLDPESVNVYHRLAELNVKQGLVGNALAEYRNLVALLEKKKLITDAIGVLQKMAELEPDNLNIRVKIAECYAQAGLRDKARVEFAQILDLLREAREFSRIVKLYEIFLPLFPDDTKIKAGFAEALIGNGDAERGLQMLKSLLREDPENSDILRSLASGYRECEDFENERLTYHHLLKQAPGDLALREAFIRACLDGGDCQRSLAELEEWQEAFFDAGCAPVLKVFYEDLLALAPDNRQIQRALTLLYEQSGDAENRFGSTALAMPLAEPSTEAVAAPTETVAEQFNEPLVAEPLNVLPDDSESFAAAHEPVAEAEGAEEIPLEFLEATACSDEPLSLAQSSGMPAVSPQVEVAAEMEAEEMEFELELVLDDPLLEVEAHPAEHFLVAETAAAEQSVAHLAELEPAEVLEDIEELEELEPAEDLDGLASAELLPWRETPFAPEPVFVEDESGGGLSGFEIDGLLSDLESVTGTAKNIRDELGEAEFYLQQGLFADAERVCRQILEFDSSCSAAREKLAWLAAQRQEAVKPPAEYELFGLTSNVKTGEDQPPTAELTLQNAADRVIHADVFEEFKIGAETPIDVEDAESHYNLGIAYKEMGLLDEAVAEFDKAMKNPARMVDSLTLKGICLFEKGDFEPAEKVFKSGLLYPALSAIERISLFYEMGLLYEAWGRPLEALDSFQAAADADLFFRGVGEKIEALRKTLGLDVKAGKEDSGARGDKSRVSYI